MTLSVSQITPAASADASPKGADFAPFPLQESEQEKSQTVTRSAEMTDEERELTAYRCGNAMQAWYSQYRISGNTECLDLAYAAMTRMREVLAGRSPEYVARLEKERGLDVPAIANEGRAG